MTEYHKIDSLWKRYTEGPNKGRFIDGEWSRPEFAYLRDNEWEFTEKVDGTNIRVFLSPDEARFGGRADSTQIPVPLLNALVGLFSEDRRKSLPETAILYGEGYGPKIQKGGGNYRDTPGFVLFDVRIGSFWLTRESVIEVASAAKLDVVPVIGRGTLSDMERICREGLTSSWGDFTAEGIVARPVVDLTARDGKRIITKLKCKDFRP